jgi:cytochrome c553
MPTKCLEKLRTAVLMLVAAACPFMAADVVRAQDAPVADPGSDAAQLAARLALGQRLYREGIGATGQPLKALGAAQTALAGKDAACATCHRRSGYGTSEGKFVIRPIIGPALLQEQTVPVQAPRVKARVGVSQRPPYSEALLARAIRTGVDAAGKPLDAVMPRYTLSDVEMKALSGYLFALSAKPSPGVDDQEIHFATVIQPGVAPERKRAMLDVMQAFVKDKGANVRSDEQRREAGNMRMYRSYRKWVLHVWELTGPSDTWGTQLDAYYSQQPVFALIGGLGHASWGPIHAFSERLEIPSVFPQVDLPMLTGANHYTIYFSRGVVLEAEVLAKFLREQGDAGKVVQVYRRGGAGSAAAAAFRTALAAAATVEDQVLEGPVPEAIWRRVYAANPGSLVLWLDASDLAGAQAPGGAAPFVYLSSSLLSGRIPDSLIKAGANTRLVYPSDLPPKREARLLRNKLWLHNKGIAITDEALQINTQFALTVVSDVVGHIMDSFSRDYFVERIEHVVGQTPMASVYQNVSLGPGQRFAAKGSSVVQVLDADKKQLKALSGWIIP